jgi:hypothetical protein
MNKIKTSLLAGGTALLGIIAGLASAATSSAQMSTTTLGTSIDSVNTTAYGYLAVVLTNYLPFIIGFVVIGAVIGIAVYLVVRLFHIK